MASGSHHAIFAGYGDVSTSPMIMGIGFRSHNGSYQVRASILNDGTTWRISKWFTIGDAAHFLEVDWHASTAPGANNGALALWIDGEQRVSLVGVDNDTRRIDRVYLGAVSGIDSDTRGRIYFDAFESRRETFIGPIPGISVALAEAVMVDPTEWAAWSEVYEGEEELPEEWFEYTEEEMTKEEMAPPPAAGEESGQEPSLYLPLLED
jgi:hypothetical protein